MESQPKEESTIPSEVETETSQSFCFRQPFEGTMILHSDAETVRAYLNAHQGWFVRCAKPMKAKPIGENSYALTIGRFGALGFQVEPQLGVELLPEEAGVYRMETVSLDTTEDSFYEVDYQASLQLVEKTDVDDENNPCGCITEVEWTLDLGVNINFPRFIDRFPRSMVQKTGDQLLRQIVRQVSYRLTKKVQNDFHHRY